MAAGASEVTLTLMPELPAPVTVRIRFPHGSQNFEWTALARHELTTEQWCAFPANKWLLGKGYDRDTSPRPPLNSPKRAS
jgi:hypothetical protein